MAFVLGAALAGAHRPKTDYATGGDDLGDAFAFDVAARFNASIIANIDAIDTALTAILAGVMAVIVFTVDHLHDVHAAETLTALALLAAAAVVCVAGYVIGFPWRGPRFSDFVSPVPFVPDFAQQPGVAAANAIRHLTVAGNHNDTAVEKTNARGIRTRSAVGRNGGRRRRPASRLGDMMASMRKGPSEELKAIAAEIAREYGIEPLREGEVRPMFYYLTEHYFDRGFRPVKPGTPNGEAKRP